MSDYLTLHVIDESIGLRIHEDLLTLDAGEFIRVDYSAEVYEGDYEVNSFVADPSFTTSKILGTKTKYMKDNVTIYSVPTKEIQNEAGGVTFVIGE